MKLTVLGWLKDCLVPFIGRIIEIIFRIILFLLPMGVFLIMLQSRQKASSTSNLSVFTTDDSRWQHIFPGFILVSCDSKSLKKSYNNIKSKFQSWVANNKYLLAFLFMSAVVTLPY